MNEFKGNVPGFPDYFITSCGRVWSFKTKKFLKIQKLKKGYCYVDLYNQQGKKHFLIHKLVADAYLDNPNNYDTVDHIDFNKENNCLENLRWISREENSGRRRNLKRIRCIETGEIFNSMADAARIIGKKLQSLSDCLRGKNKTCAGFHWQFYDEKEG